MKKRFANEKMTYGIEQMAIGCVAAVVGATGLRALMIGADRENLAARLECEYPLVRPSREGEVAPALEQLREYFAGSRRLFDLRIDLRGLSDFSLRTLEALRKIPFGETVTYGELASRIGRPRSARAVGRVMSNNRLPLVLPCHRVVGAGGALTGYSGGEGVSTKQWLLEFEKRLS